jgi:hypothetical protein
MKPVLVGRITIRLPAHALRELQERAKGLHRSPSGHIRAIVLNDLYGNVRYTPTRKVASA